MARSPFDSAPRRRAVALAPSWVVAGFVAVIVLFGGSAQFGRLSDLPPRLAALGLIAFLIVRGIGGRIRLRPPERVLCWGLLLVPAMQLMPLPPAIWRTLGDRAALAEVYRAAGMARPWLPISLAPDRTLDALFFLLVPAAAFLLGRAGDRDLRRTVLLAVVVLAAASGVLGLLQMAGGGASSLRLYAVANRDGPIGFFANRNHFALFMALALVLGGGLAATSPGRARWLAWTAGTAVALGLIVATQSRAGIALGLIAALATPLMAVSSQRARWRVIAAGAVILSLGAAALATGPLAERFARLQHDDPRADVLGRFLNVARANLPTGSGLGSFERLYPRYETLGELVPSYWNHAHVEPVQVVIEAGLPGIVLLLLFLAWWARMLPLCRAAPGSGRDVASLRMAMLGTGLILLHSLVDYPLRTAAIAGLFAFLCGVAARQAAPRSAPLRF